MTDANDKTTTIIADDAGYRSDEYRLSALLTNDWNMAVQRQHPDDESKLLSRNEMERLLDNVRSRVDDKRLHKRSVTNTLAHLLMNANVIDFDNLGSARELSAERYQGIIAEEVDKIVQHRTPSEPCADSVRTASDPFREAVADRVIGTLVDSQWISVGNDDTAEKVRDTLIEFLKDVQSIAPPPGLDASQLGTRAEVTRTKPPRRKSTTDVKLREMLEGYLDS